MIRKIITVLLSLALLFALCACGTAAVNSADEKKTEIIVFAAASMTETVTEIKGIYEAANPSVTLTCNFDSSGTLAMQIEEGAVCDVFISSGQNQMNRIDAGVNSSGADFILSESRVDLLENKITLVVPEGNPSGIQSFDDLASRLAAGTVFMAIGNSDVPVGQYTREIFAFYGLDETELAAAGTLTYGSNVKEVTMQVSEASVDCGVIYCTDAFSAGLEIVDLADESMCGKIIYPAAVLKNSTDSAAAQAFLDFLSSDEAMAVFKAVGFSPAV